MYPRQESGSDGFPTLIAKPDHDWCLLGFVLWRWLRGVLWGPPELFLQFADHQLQAFASHRRDGHSI